MELATVNQSTKWPPATLREPLPYGYVHVAAAVEPPRQPGPPFPGRSPRKAALLSRLKELAAELQGLDAVERAPVSRAVLVPPAEPGAAHPARFDVAVLIETTTADRIAEVQAAEPYRQLLPAGTEAPHEVPLIAARHRR